MKANRLKTPKKVNMFRLGLKFGDEERGKLLVEKVLKLCDNRKCSREFSHREAVSSFLPCSHMLLHPPRDGVHFPSI